MTISSYKIKEIYESVINSDTLCLYDNFDYEHLEFLYHIFKINKTFKKINIECRGCFRFSTEKIELICRILNKCSSVVHIRIIEYSNNIDPFPFSNIITSICSNNHNLKRLDLSRSIKNINDLSILFESISNTTIKTIDLSYNEFDDSIFKKIVEFIKSNVRNITQIVLSCCSIENNHIMELSNSLKINTILKNIDLSSNFFNHKCIRFISEALITNSTLKTLRIDYNYIYGRGIYQLCNMLLINRTLEKLYMKYPSNYIKLKHVFCLINALKINNSLRIIHFFDDESFDDQCTVVDDIQTKTLTLLKEYNSSLIDVKFDDSCDHKHHDRKRKIEYISEIDKFLERNKIKKKFEETNFLSLVSQQLNKLE